MYFDYTVKISDQCLTKDVSDNFASVLSDLSYLLSEPLLIFDILVKSPPVVATIAECGMEDAIEDFDEYCKRFSCGYDLVIGNVQTSLFELMNDAN